jgi:hypothetical protein
MIQHFITLHQVMLASLSRHKSAMFLSLATGNEKVRGLWPPSEERSTKFRAERSSFSTVERTYTRIQTAW